ncbi:hypothetical protein [Corynebacterium sp. SA-MJD20WY100]|uniref:hypothetical protein n=1 Tax=Corynebacterium sp. SA-MJD20WY100 TaxID=3142969 RepID=UPI00322169A3
MNTIARRVAAGIATASLAIGLVACGSDAEDAANTAKDTAGSAANEATAAAGSAVDSAKDSMKDSESAGASEGAEGSEAEGSETNGAEGSEGAADGEKTTINTAAGEFEIPAAFASALESKASEWGMSMDDIQNITNSDAGSVATFAKDKLLAFNNESGESVPVIGKIAETFESEGGLESLGLPESPEQAVSDGEGWVQEFTNATVKWVKGESGEFAADIQKK